jgi:hypothetical protein
MAPPPRPEPDEDLRADARPRGARAWLDRAAMVAVIACSVMMASRLGSEQPERLSGNMRLVAAALSGDALARSVRSPSASRSVAPVVAATEAEKAHVGTAVLVPAASVAALQSNAPKKNDVAGSTRIKPAAATPEQQPVDAPETNDMPPPKSANPPSLAEAMAAAVGKKLEPAGDSAPAAPGGGSPASLDRQ